jgi:hypothetical protein
VLDATLLSPGWDFLSLGSHLMSGKRIGDRRRYLRFDVIGGMAASVASTQTLRVVNVAATGALVEASLPLEADVTYPMRFVIDSHVSELTARVRRVTEIGDSAPATFLIGLEFLNLSDDARERIGQLVAAQRLGT